MALHSATYQRDPDCQAFETRLGRIHAESRRQSAATVGLTDWRSALAEQDAIADRMLAAAEAELDSAAAARGLRVVETYDPNAGYWVDLVAEAVRAD